MPEKAVLMSIQKHWLDKILCGNKIIEVRGRRPADLKPPFQVYLYETCNEGGCGKVRAIALCTGLFRFSKSDFNGEDAEAFLEASCLTREQLAPFFWSRQYVYGWQMADVHPIDMEIIELGAKRAPQGWQYCDIPVRLTPEQKKALFLGFEAFSVAHRKKHPAGWFEGVITYDGKVVTASSSHNKTLINLYGKTEEETWKEMPVTAAPIYWLAEKTRAVPVYNNGYMQPEFILSDSQRYVLTLLAQAGLSRNTRIA